MTDTDIGPLAAALAKAQATFPTIPRDKEVTVKMKTGGEYKFKYAPLDTILAAVRGPLSANGLAIVQMLDGDGLVTLLLHESGARLEGRVRLHEADNVQGLGSEITYLRRYAIQAMLGLAAEEDDDGNRASGNRATVTMPRRDVDRSTGEILRPRPVEPPRPSVTPSGPSEADIAALHAQSNGRPVLAFSPGEIEAAVSAPMSTPELFSRAEEAGVTKAQLTLSAKSMFGQNRWKVTDLTDDERAVLWEEVAPMVPA